MAGCTPGEIIDALKERGLWDLEPRDRLIKTAKPVPKSVASERPRADIARWLWSTRRPIEGTLAERYLRQVRGISCPLPPTLGYLPARGDNPHAMIAAFGMTVETEPGVLVIPHGNVVAVHLTKLTPASDKIEKIMVGSPRGAPIVLSPVNDLLGLAVTEGIEEGLSVFQATGLGVWAAGAAGLVGSLGDVVPAWIDQVTIMTDIADAKHAGVRGAMLLIEALRRRGVYAEAVPSRTGGFDG